MSREFELLPYELSIAGIPELDEFVDQDVSHIISLIDPDLPDLEIFEAFTGVRRFTIRMHDIIEEAEGELLPTHGHVSELLEIGAQLVEDTPTHLLIHCHMGTSRSTAAAAIILGQHNPGREAEALAHVRRIRRPSWPNSLMLRLADELLGREEAYSKAVKQHYREMAQAYPGLAEYFLATPRAVEVPDDF